MRCVSLGATGSQEVGECLKACTPFVKVENGHLTIKFDEIRMLLFGHKVPGILLVTCILLFLKSKLSNIEEKQIYN